MLHVISLIRPSSQEITLVNEAAFLISSSERSSKPKIKVESVFEKGDGSQG